MWGFLQEGTLMLWRWIGGEIVMLVGALGTWPVIVETEDEGDQWKEEEWSMEVDELRRLSIYQTI